jgi:hypothetical protein
MKSFRYRSTYKKDLKRVVRRGYDMITHPKEVAALYDEKLPDGAKAAIVKRDAGTSS